MLFSPSVILFLLMILFSLAFVISSSSLILCWVGLEINTLAFIPLLLSANSKGLSDSSIKYFLTQALASVLFLLSLVVSPISGQVDQPLTFLLVIALLVKLGAAPFHAWVPSIVESLSWFVLFFLLTIQKLNPLCILLSQDFLDLNKNLIFFSVISSVLVGSFLGVVQVRVRKIMTFSSINHMGWVLVAFLMGVKLTFIYFFTYMILLSAIISVFSEFNLQHINQVISSPIFGLWAPLLFLNLLSLGGLPPFLGFLPKWILLQEMIFMNFFALSLVMILTSLIVLYFYLRLTFSAFMLKKLSWASKPEVSLSSSMLFLNIISVGGLTLSFLI